MGRSCTVCNHPCVEEINRLLLSNVPYRSVAKRFEISESAVFRHKSSHLRGDLVEVHQAMVEAREQALAEIHNRELEEIKNDVRESTTGRLAAAVSALDKVRALQERTIKILDTVEAEDDRASTLKAVREVRQNIELEAKLTGEIEGDQVNVNTVVNLDIYRSPEWLAVGALLQKILAHYPDLRAEVAKELLALQEAHR